MNDDRPRAAEPLRDLRNPRFEGGGDRGKVGLEAVARPGVPPLSEPGRRHGKPGFLLPNG